ncbi:hypothetical protein DQM07_12415 [Lacticaseibacillus paracasei subsp. paracasei]|nr:hypothetical protein [Lacticaseibacillus paracasei]RDV40669.1 hypothetical protein DQM07_12415 [Lacticaseibacillus paracasei subsp. paracasei]
MQLSKRAHMSQKPPCKDLNSNNQTQVIGFRATYTPLFNRSCSRSSIAKSTPRRTGSTFVSNLFTCWHVCRCAFSLFT